VKLISSTINKNIKDFELTFKGNFSDDGYVTQRDYFQLADTRNGEVIFPEIIFFNLIAISPARKFALLMMDQKAKEAYYDLVLFIFETGQLYRLHTMGRGKRQLDKVDWKSDFKVQYEACILNSELRAEQKDLPISSNVLLHLEIYVTKGVFHSKIEVIK
jgi:hypothetical protein